jgi:hypothetical protein
MKHALLSGLALGVFCVIALAARGGPGEEAARAQAAGRQASPAPGVANGRLEAVAVAGGLARTIDGLVSPTAAAWLGYAVQAVAGEPWVGGEYDGAGCRTVYLEGRRAGSRLDRPSGPRSMTVLMRLGADGVQRIRVAGADCDLDAGGLTVHWLAGVDPAESVAFLSRYVKTDEGAKAGVAPSWNAALAALALHACPEATRALERFVAGGQPATVRKRAAFWLGSTRGAAGLATLRGYAEADPDPAFRKELPFALSVSPEVEAVDMMIGMARRDTDADVRRQAIFWLGQKAGEKVVGTLADVAHDDPESAIKERAVFALSRLPDGEGVEKLIDVARTNKDQAVRKRAIFWLSRSDDPRALDYITGVLTGRR